MDRSIYRFRKAIAAWTAGALAAYLSAAGPASAFDCAKASTEVEKTICGDQEAKRANAEMEGMYFALREQLDDDGRAMLLAGQKNWLTWRDMNCDASDAACLAEKSNDRATVLGSTPPGMAPFYKWQQGDNYHYDVVINGYRFTGEALGAEAAYHDWLDRVVANTPLGEEMDIEVETPNLYTHEVAIDVARLNSRLISSIAWTYDYSGGAHGSGWTTAVNIDRNTGAILDAESIFGKDGIEQLADECRHQVAADRAYPPDNITEEDALKELEELYPGVVAQSAADMNRWRFSEEGGIIQFDPYAIGPYSAGPFECVFPDAKIQALALDPAMFATGN